MPSPIAHSAAGYVIYRFSKGRKQSISEEHPKVWRSSSLLVILFLSLLPDFDFIPGLFFHRVDQFHNSISHSLFFGFMVSLTISTMIWIWRRSNFIYWFILVIICYELHVVMDYFTVGRGVMIFWPFSSVRYVPALKLFYGLHRSDGLWSVRHLWTLITELAFTGIIILFSNLRIGLPKRKKLVGKSHE